MKKFLLSLAVMFMATQIVDAQIVRAKVVGSKAVRSEIHKNFGKKNTEVKQLTANGELSSFTVNAAQLKKASAKLHRADEEINLSAMYNYPFGSLFEAVYDEGWYSRQDIYSPAMVELEWDNYSSWDKELPVTFKWTLNDEEMQMGDDNQGIGEMFGASYVPVLSLLQGTDSVGYQATSSTTQGDVPNVWWGGMETFARLSNAAPQLGVYSGFTNGPSFTTNENFYETGKKLVGFAELYPKPQGYVYADSAYVLLICDEAAGKRAPLGGKELQLTICTFDDEGKFVPYATGVCTDNEMVDFENGLFLAKFPFIEKDDILGNVEAPIALPDEDFIVLIEGFDKIKNTFIAAFSSADGFEGFGYALLEDGSLSSVNYRDSETPQINLHIGFNAIIPVAELVNEDTKVYFPSEGGLGITGFSDEGTPYNDVDFYSMSPATTEDSQWYLGYETSDWVTEISADDQYLDNGYVLFFFSAEALPEGMESREGQIVLSLYGKEVVIPIYQGDVLEGIATTTASKREKSIYYNMQGVGMAQPTKKGIYIKNNKKVVVK